MIGQLGAKSDAWFKLVCFYLDPGWFVCFLSCVFLPQRVALNKYYRWFLFFMVGMAATWGVGGLDGLLDLRPLFPETAP